MKRTVFSIPSRSSPTGIARSSQCGKKNSPASHYGALPNAGATVSNRNMSSLKKRRYDKEKYAQNKSMQPNLDMSSNPSTASQMHHLSEEEV